MSNPKFVIGQQIITKTGVEGHVVLVMNPFVETERQYYCSMYPGAQEDYVWIECIDLLCTCFDPHKKRFTTTQALNIYSESELSEVIEE